MDKRIKEAKTGTHHIAFQPGREATEVRVAKVRGGLVHVVLPNGDEIGLNQTASEELLNGEYR